MRAGVFCLAGLFLAACSSPAARREAYDAARAELKAEMSQMAAQLALAQEKAKQEQDAVSKALLPPVAGMAARAPREERFSLALNNVPAQQFFNAVVAGSRYNMLVHPDVAGNLSANLKDVTLFEALDAIREVYGYDYKVEGNRIYIKPLTMQTRIFQVNYLNHARLGASDLRVANGSVSDAINNSSNNNNNNSTNNNNSNANNSNNSNNNNNGGSQRSSVESSRVSTATVADFWSELKFTLQAIISTRGEGRSVTISPQSGVVVVRAMPDELRSVEEYLKATQLSVERQVILEAKILEVQLNDGYQSGINWSAFTSLGGKHDNRFSAGLISPGSTIGTLGTGAQSSSGDMGLTVSMPGSIPGGGMASPTTALGSLFGIAFQTNNFGALISFLESQGTVHVLSSPRIATLNNQKAVLKIGTDEFFVTGVTPSVTNTNTNGSTVTNPPSVTLTPFFSGVVLDVTPQIDDRGNVTLHVHPAVSQVSNVNKTVNLGSSGVFTLPLATSSTSETDSVVRGQDGQIIAIGGLMRQSAVYERDQLPGSDKLGPLSGAFGNTRQSTAKRELVILIKPSIVKNGEAFSRDLQQSIDKLERMGQTPAKAGS
ncbi:secretin N-terminal domain-containing protein [Massilia sp. W12]|uniref:secretin N-terminal domain-containing protein n=1 Tax=Massilia sp. W12 TaxID=3126507 RepID=UPI0030CE4510